MRREILRIPPYSTIKLTADTYSHLGDRLKQDVADLIDNALDG